MQKRTVRNHNDKYVVFYEFDETALKDDAAADDDAEAEDVDD